MLSVRRSAFPKKGETPHTFIQSKKGLHNVDCGFYKITCKHVPFLTCTLNFGFTSPWEKLPGLVGVRRRRQCRNPRNCHTRSDAWGWGDWGNWWIFDVGFPTAWTRTQDTPPTVSCCCGQHCSGPSGQPDQGCQSRSKDRGRWAGSPGWKDRAPTLRWVVGRRAATQLSLPPPGRCRCDCGHVAWTAAPPFGSQNRVLWARKCFWQGPWPELFCSGQKWNGRVGTWGHLACTGPNRCCRTCGRSWSSRASEKSPGKSGRRTLPCCWSCCWSSWRGKASPSSWFAWKAQAVTAWSF